MNRLLRCLIFIAIEAAIAAAPLQAADVFWNVTNGDMNNAANWNPQQLPTSSDNTFIVNGGTAYLNADYSASLNEVYVGNGSGNGILRINGGTITTGDIFLGDYSSGDANGGGAYYQSGGTVNMKGTMVMGGYNTASPTNYGYLNLSNGNLNVNGWEFMVAWVNTGVVDQSGGTLNAPFQSMRVGYWGDAYGVYNLTGGTINTSAWEPVFGQLGTGVLNVSGGLFKANVYGILLGWDGGTGIVNVGAVSSGLSTGGGGTIDTAYIFNRGVGSGTVNFHGGTIKVHAASAGGPDRSNLNFFGSSNCYVYGEGAVFDTAGTPAQINTPLQAPTGSGLVSIPVADGGSGYIGAPAVHISGGSGSGATAVATVVNGVVTGFTITNPGVGYSPSDVLTVTLSGGGTNTPATVGALSAANFAENVSGGLTKHGAGTLTLNAPCTYTGPTVVDGGTLAITGGNLASSGITVKSGGTLGGSSVVTNLVDYPTTTVETGGTVAPGTPGQYFLLNELKLANNTNLKFTFVSGVSDQINVDNNITATASGPVTVNLAYSGLITAPTQVLSIFGSGSLANNITFSLPGGKPMLDSDDGINSPVSISTQYGVGGSVTLNPGGAIADPAWNSLSGGNWSAAANWGSPPAGAYPNGGDKRGMFTASLGNGSIPIKLDVSPQLSSMVFASPGGESYVISASDAKKSITLDSTIAQNWNITVLGGSHTVAANLRLGTGSGLSIIRLAFDSSLTLSGVLSNETTPAAVNFSGNFSEAGTTTGILTLSGLNTYTGPTTVNNGTLVVTNLGAAGSPSSIGAATAESANWSLTDSVLRYSGPVASTNRGLTVANDATIDTASDLTVAGQLAGSNLTMTANIRNQFLKQGPGTLTLSNNSSNFTTDSIQVQGGALVLNAGTYSAKQILVTSTQSAAALYVNGNATLPADASQTGGDYANYSIGARNGYLRIAANITRTGGQDFGVGFNDPAHDPVNPVGVVDQFSGNVTTGERLQIGGNGGFGVYNLAGGTLQTDGIRWGDVIGWGGGPEGAVNTGILSVFGGGAYKPQSGLLGLAGTGAVGVLNIGGVDASKGGAGAGDGSVVLASISPSGGQAIVNFHGGTLHAAGGSPVLLQDGTSVNVYGENATIDTNGSNVLLTTPLLAPNGKGLTGISLANPGSGYVGAPAVEITGGGGSGATAMAVMNGDRVDRIVITNPGIGYTGTPTVTLVGGCNGVAATANAAAPIANVSGGLTKNGSGTLTLHEGNTYTGPTVVHDGTLQLSLRHQAMIAPIGAVGTYNDGPYSMGQSFSVAAGSSIQVTQLGVFDSGADGLVGAHVVHITDLATNTDTAATATFAVGSGKYSYGYRFLSLASPVSLPAGDYNIWVDTIGGGFDPFADNYQNVLDSGSLGAVTFGNCYYSKTTGVVPTTLWGNSHIGSTVSFAFYNPSSLIAGNVLADSTPVVLGGPAGSTPIFDLGGVNQQIASLADAPGAVVKGSVINSETDAPVTLTLSLAEGVATYSGSIGASINLVKTGAGTQILSGSLATYNGNTTVDAGTLSVSSLNTPLSTVYVATGATLNADSIVADTLTIGGVPRAGAAGTQSVPEPGTFLMLILAASTLFGIYHQRNR